MDGNGRWAQQRGLPRQAGHKQAAETVKKILNHCSEIGLECLTLYAFSTENWKRPKAEVDDLMVLFRQYLKELLRSTRNKGERILFLGDRAPLEADLRDLMEQAEQASREKQGMLICFAINYGGRDEIIHAIRRLAQEVRDGRMLPSDIDEQVVSDHLYTAGIPDPDFIIRTSGEMRSSNFLTWQSVYAEYVFTDVLWPDFSLEHFDHAIEEYAGRRRRYGGV